MKNILLSGILMCFTATSLYAGQGKLRVSSEPSGAYVYVDGKKKAMTGEGFTSILLEKGDHSIKVAKAIDENYEYIQTKKVFVGEETSTKLSFKLNIGLKASVLAHKNSIKLARWKRSGEVVIDTKLGLIWQDNSKAKTVKKKWKSAKKYCRNLSLRGYSDWQLPSHDELLTIVDYDRYKPAIMPSFKNVASDNYWLHNQHVHDIKNAWNVSFSDGSTGYNIIEKSNELYVRCVRHR